MNSFAKITANITAAGALFISAFFPAACNTIQPVAQATTGGCIIEQLKLNKSINVSLGGMMTFNENGQNVTAFKEFGVQNVPLMWMDTTFMGNTTSNPAPEKQVIDHVHGVATHDGKYLEHVSFWQEIKQVGQPDIIFDITVYAVPIDGTGGANCIAAKTFQRNGDVKKYVLDLTYIQEGVDYVCTDWTNTAQPPTLNIQFGQ